VKVFDNSCEPQTKFRRATAIYSNNSCSVTEYVVKHRQWDSMEDTKFKLVEVRRFQQKFSLLEHVIEWKILFRRNRDCYATFVVRTAVIPETRFFGAIRPCGVPNCYLHFQGSSSARHVLLDFLTPKLKNNGSFATSSNYLPVYIRPNFPQDLNLHFPLY
jgi:hypothetical protein